MTYFSTFIPGLGKVVEKHLASILQNYQTIQLFDGLIIYQTHSSYEEVKSIKFLNNSYLLLREFQNLANNPINGMAKMLAKECPQLPIKIRGSFRVMGSLANEPSAVHKDILEKLEKTIEGNLHIMIDRTSPDHEFLILYRNEGFGLFGLRLTKHPDYKKTLAKGQLRPELSHLLCLLSDPQPDDVFLDPFAGSGAICLARKEYPYKEIFCGDIQPANEKIQKLDATDLKDFPNASVTKIITDPPWGVSIGISLDLKSFYFKMLQEFSRVLSKGGMAIILIGKKDIFDEVLRKLGNTFQKDEVFRILVSGKKSGVYVIKKN